MIDLVLLLMFVLYALISGLRARREASRSAEEFFLAGRTLRGWQAGCSMAATQFAADTPLLVTGLIATGGLFMLWRLWIYGLAFLAMAVVFAALWHRSGVITDAALAEHRYSAGGALTLRTVKALYFGTLVNCVVLAMVLAAALRITEQFIPWHAWLPENLYAFWLQVVEVSGIRLIGPVSELDPLTASANNLLSVLSILLFTALYSLTGGLRSVVRTDVVQLAVALAGTLIYALVLLGHTGGIDAMLAQLRDLYGSAHAHRILAMAPPADDTWLAFGVLIGLQWLYQMNSDGTGYLAQRAIACRDEREARIACIVFAWLQIVLRSAMWILIGIALLIAFPVAPGEPGHAGFAAAREGTFVTGIDELLPPGVRGLMLIAMLAALTSTVDTHLNWGAAYWSHDLYGRLLCDRLLSRSPSRREEVVVGRIAGVLILILALFLTARLDSIAQAWSISLIFGAGIGPALIARWLWERANVWSEFAAMAISLVMAPVVLIAFDADWQRLTVIALCSTAAVVLAARFAPETAPATLDAFYCRVQPSGWWCATAARCGEAAEAPLRRLQRQTVVFAVAAGSLFLSLWGLVRLMLPPQPDASAWLPGALALFAGLGLVPVWWRQLTGPSIAPQPSPAASN